MILDIQRPNGAVPCFVPCTPKYGFFWCSGPGWDFALFEFPEQLYRFTGNDSMARDAYGAMKRYLGFVAAKEDDDGLVNYGLGEWAAPKGTPKTPEKFTDTAFCYEMNRRASVWAERFGEPEEARRFAAHAQEIRAAFNRYYYKGDGVYNNGTLTELVTPLYFPGLCADGAEPKVLAALVRGVREKRHQAWFGIFGAKWIPRVLAAHGYVDDAWQVLTQTDYPGWGFNIKNGATTLFEEFGGGSSHNHIMYGDFSGWAYEYVAGIRIAKPGFAEIELRPAFPKGLDDFTARHTVPGKGEIVSSWRRTGDQISYTCTVPAGVRAKVTLPGVSETVSGVTKSWTVK